MTSGGLVLGKLQNTFVSNGSAYTPLAPPGRLGRGTGPQRQAQVVEAARILSWLLPEERWAMARTKALSPSALPHAALSLAGEGTQPSCLTLTAHPAWFLYPSVRLSVVSYLSFRLSRAVLSRLSLCLPSLLSLSVLLHLSFSICLFV